MIIIDPNFVLIKDQLDLGINLNKMGWINRKQL